MVEERVPFDPVNPVQKRSIPGISFRVIIIHHKLVDEIMQGFRLVRVVRIHSFWKIISDLIITYVAKSYDRIVNCVATFLWHRTTETSASLMSDDISWIGEADSGKYFEFCKMTHNALIN